LVKFILQQVNSGVTVTETSHSKGSKSYILHTQSLCGYLSGLVG